MQNPVLHTILNNSFWVSPERCLYWEQENTLIVADLHLGKTGHFRKEGIAVPQSVYKADLQRLISQLYLFKAERLIIVG
ncbi:MAG: metallophosphoesterase, partial [Chitinophagales bacterium]